MVIQQSLLDCYKAVISERREQALRDGVLYNGAKIRCTADSVGLIKSAIESGKPSINFKAINGWYVFSQAQLSDILRVINLRIQECFDTELKHINLISAYGTETQIKSHDFNKYW